MKEINEKGYRQLFKCSQCGEMHELEEMHYFNLRGTRVCNDCFDDYRNTMKENENE